ncbi:putative hydrolase of the HAD superfamily [Fusobacterium naviforme]|nr:HAD family phosphatase [Fusobacterium naviforme]PSL11156.1 putative hydrolase of the HAD superfamily [Fusobacterium naviforme]STO28531.1 Phosphatase yihX [Fusobacterium naviforme]
MLKNIIFDVGDVLLEYRWPEALMALGLPEQEARTLGRRMVHDPIWTMMDYGVMTPLEVAEKMRIVYPEQGDKIQWMMEHPKTLYVPRPEIWERVHRLKKQGYRLFILSNYGKEMWEAHAAFQPFMQDMDGAVISYRMHLLKPNRDIYEYLLDTYALKPEESLFFDDRRVNTDGAKSAGIPSVTVRSREFLRETLDRILAEGEDGVPEEAAEGV